MTRVAGGAPGAVLLTGPPGVGKTRLAREVLAVAEHAGFLALAGRAQDVGHEVAYAPVVEAFGGFLRGLDPRSRAGLVGDLSQLALLFAGLGLDPPAALGDPGLERARLTEGFLQLVERLVRERPLALLFDDVHAADMATVALLRSLILGLGDWPILLLLTARPDEPGRDRVAVLSADLAVSAGWAEQHAVPPLGEAEASALLGRLLGSPVEERLAAQVLERCAGRPLFLEAVARTLQESGRLTERGGVLILARGGLPLPTGIHSQLRARLAATSVDEQTVLRLLAVAAVELEPDLLARASRLPPQALFEALDRLHRRGLAVTGAEGGYELAHGLLRDALLADLSPPARQRAHADLIEALEAARPEDPRIAEHVLGAGALIVSPAALDHLLRGAGHALRVGAAEDASRYLARAVAMCRERGRSDQLAGLLADLADVQARLGEPGQARATFAEAAAEYGRRGDATGVARAERELAMLAWSDGDLAGARGHLTTAETALDGLEPSREHGWLLHARMVVAVRVGDAAAVSDAAGRLRELAAGLGSSALAAHADLAEGASAYAQTDYVAAAAHDRRALDAAVSADEPLLALRAHDQLSVVAGAELDLRALREHSRASVEEARRLGGEALVGWPRGRLAIADLLAGDWEAAIRGASELAALADRLADRRGRMSALAMRAFVLVHRGRLTDAGALLERAREVATPALETDRNVFSMVALAEATLALAQDDPARAARRGSSLGEPVAGWLPVLSAGVLGEALVAGGDLERARRLAGRLRAVRSCATGAPAVFADWVDGLADLAARPADGRLARLRSAAAGFERLGLPFQRARAGLAAASAVATRDRDAAIGEARAALETFDGLGAPIQARQARVLLRSLGETPSRGRARRPTGSPLSARELEVGRLVASGLSNAEVATRLFISPRTVTTHLDRIYTKLELRSRVALTRYLADSSLLEQGRADRA